MKKYKLIKEYPGSPNIGTIIINSSSSIKGIGFMIKINSAQWDEGKFFIQNPENYPEFWEEVVEKDYEILSVISNLTGKVENVDSEGYVDFGDCVYVDDIVKSKNYDIHLVRRKSDGEVFTVGDKVVHEYYKGNPKIEKIYFIEKDRLSVYIGGGWNVSIAKIEKVKNPLFRTEDGIDIYEGDSYVTMKQHGYGKKYFSTKEAAEEYILMNKPCLSINDLKDKLTIEYLKKIVKSKL